MATKRALNEYNANADVSPKQKRQCHASDLQTLAESGEINATKAIANGEHGFIQKPSINTSQRPTPTSQDAKPKSIPESPSDPASDSTSSSGSDSGEDSTSNYAENAKAHNPSDEDDDEDDSTSSSGSSGSSNSLDAEEGDDPSATFDGNGQWYDPLKVSSSSSEGTISVNSQNLGVDDDEEKAEEITTLPIPAKPSISRPVQPSTGGLEDRLKSFLPALEQANLSLPDNGGDPASDDKEEEGGGGEEEGHVEMDLALGVLEEKKANGEIQIRDPDADRKWDEGDGIDEDGSVLDRLLGRRGEGVEAPGIHEVESI